jgi:hypothetical protein
MRPFLGNEQQLLQSGFGLFVCIFPPSFQSPCGLIWPSRDYTLASMQLIKACTSFMRIQVPMACERQVLNCNGQYF